MDGWIEVCFGCCFRLLDKKQCQFYFMCGIVSLVLLLLSLVFGIHQNLEFDSSDLSLALIDAFSVVGSNESNNTVIQSNH